VSDRDAFEAWAEGKFNLTPLAGEGAFFYDEERTQAAWDGWQASRRAALEESAKVCEKILGPHEYSGLDVDCYQETADRCAAAIRALAGTET